MPEVTCDFRPGDSERGTSPQPGTANRSGVTLSYSDPTAKRSDEPVQDASPADQVPDKLPGVPGYEVLRVLGRGGMGVVYEARHVALNRVVALKMILAGGHASANDLARFRHEAEAVAQLQHPNVVQIYELGEHEGRPFFTLEFLDGGNLERKLGGTPLPVKEAAAIVGTLAAAIGHAHKQGILHRDLKPSNVLLTGDGTLKVTDFGLAKQLEGESAETHSGAILGTPNYMAPEQADGHARDVGAAADGYALGAILYEALTGRPPFVGATMLDTLAQVTSREPLPPTRLQPKVPRDLETICLKCLQKDPRKRYSDCDALADDLHRFLAGKPIQARPVGRIERGLRWCRRNPRIAALSTAIVFLLLALTLALGVVIMRMDRERVAVIESGKAAAQRLAQATEAAAGGDYQRAQDLLRWSDPLLSTHAALMDVRNELDTLERQLTSYADFKALLDNARFACRFGTRQQKEEGRRYCQQLLALYDEIEGRRDRGAAGLPPLNPEQQQLFKEDVFEAFLTAAEVEQDLARGGGTAAEQGAAQQALIWLNRVDRVLPGTRALRVHRAPCWAKVGNHGAEKADRDQARAISPTSAVDHFWLGYAIHLDADEAMRKKDVKAAHEFYRKEIAEYAAFLQLRPDHFWGYFNWANCHAQLNERHDLHDALIGFTACMRLRHDFPWPYNNRGTVHLRLGEHDLAVADFTAALARNPNYAEAHANRGLAYVAMDKMDLALEDFTQAITLNPDYAPAYTERAEIYRKRKQYTEAVRDYTRLLALSAEKAPLLEKRAAAYRALNQADEAIQDYGQLVTLNPKNLQARGARGELLVVQGKYAAAHEDFTRVLDAAPKVAAAWRARAIVNWLNLKDFDAALADFEQFAQLAPNDPEPHRCIGAILLGRRQYGPALAALKKALDLRPGYPEAVWASAQIHLWRKQPELALQELDPLVAKVPDGPPETLNVRAAVHAAMGQFDKAEADYKRMIELKSKEPEAYLCLARIYDQQGQPEKATECLDRLVSAAPESEWSYLRRAEHRRDRGEYDAALEDCDRAARIKPAWALPPLVGASVEAARGRAATAVAEAERALEKAPKHDGHALYSAACVFSLAARTAAEPAASKRYEERAAALLAEAFDMGFHDLSFPEHNRMADDPALEPIRQNPQILALITHKAVEN